MSYGWLYTAHNNAALFRKTSLSILRLIEKSISVESNRFAGVQRKDASGFRFRNLQLPQG
jgi:hypothetical protein